jgi:hypothetical protein
MRSGATAVLLVLLGTSARAEIELSVGPNLQLDSSANDDGSIGTGFLVRALHSTGTGHAWGIAVEGLWLLPTGTDTATVFTQQDLLLVNRLRPPVGRREILGIDVAVGATHFSGHERTFHPTFQLGASISGRIGGPFRLEVGARLSFTPNLFYPDSAGPFTVPTPASTRFGGVLSAVL